MDIRVPNDMTVTVSFKVFIVTTSSYPSEQWLRPESQWQSFDLVAHSDSFNFPQVTLHVDE